MQKNMHRESAATDSRRRFPRIRKRFPLTISTCDEKGRPVQAIDKNALTLDLSLGGVKISSNSEIPANKILHFSFQDDHHPPVTGIGEVRWSQRKEGPLPFQAGLSFLDTPLPPDVGERLGLH